jgi:dephospho-CoA kinase
MLIIGLTGGIGSGKSTVAKLFEKKGITVIDADQVARDITLPEKPALKKIIEKFGSDILLPNSTLDRAKLRKLIFEDDHKRIWLEQLLHPMIRDELEQQIKAANSPYCIVMIPLLIESSPNPLINRILVVDAKKEAQLERAATRDNQTGSEIYSILSKQATRAQRLKAADDVISNMGTLEDLQGQVDAMHKYYMSLT